MCIFFDHEEICSSETSVNFYLTTGHYIPQNILVISDLKSPISLTQSQLLARYLVGVEAKIFSLFNFEYVYFGPGE
jgi:hypothetical protein